MNPEQKKKLKASLPYMKENLKNVHAVVDQLIRLKTLTLGQKSDIIKLGTTEQGNVQRMVETLQASGASAYDNFLIALRNTNNGHIVDNLSNRSKTSESRQAGKATLSVPDPKSKRPSPSSDRSTTHKPQSEIGRGRPQVRTSPSKTALEIPTSPRLKSASSGPSLSSIKENIDEESAAAREDITKSSKKMEEVLDLLQDLTDKKLENGINLLQQLAKKQVERDKKLNAFCETMQSEMKLYREKAEDRDKTLTNICSQLQEEVLLYRIKTDECNELRQKLHDRENEFETLKIKQEKLRQTLDEDRTKLESRYKQNLHQARLIEKQQHQIRELETKLREYHAVEKNITDENDNVRESNRQKDIQILNLRGEADRNMTEKHKIYLHSQMENSDLRSQMETMKEELEKERDMNEILQLRIKELIIKSHLVPSFSTTPPIKRNKSLSKSSVAWKKSAISKYSFP